MYFCLLLISFKICIYEDFSYACFINCLATSNVGAGDQKPDYEFNVWTQPDCAGTSYENRNRSYQNSHLFHIEVFLYKIY